jgi:nucleoside-diphosphate-sugar epimerase
MLNKDLDYIFDNISQEISHLNEKKILIIGGTGFFGKNLLSTFKYLIDSNKIKCNIDIISRSNPSFIDKNNDLFNFEYFSFIEHDIINKIEIANEYDFIIHAATTASQDLINNNPSLMFKTIIDGTINVLDFCATGKATLLYISSGAIFGTEYDLNKDYTVFNKIDPMKGNFSYHLGKLSAENLCFYYSNKFNFTIKIARCFAFIGPHLPLDTHFAVGNFIKSIIKKEKIVINTRGQSIRSFLYTSDLIIWLIKILIIGNNLKPYNVGSPDGISIKNLALKCAQNNNIDVEFKNINENPTFYVPNVDETLSDLKIDRFIDIDTAIEKTINWIKQ